MTKLLFNRRIFSLKNLHNSNFLIIFVAQMNQELNIVINYNKHGSCCWAAFLKMGALLIIQDFTAISSVCQRRYTII